LEVLGEVLVLCRARNNEILWGGAWRRGTGKSRHSDWRLVLRFQGKACSCKPPTRVGRFTSSIKIEGMRLCNTKFMR
jgi:hypothetical protein